MGWGQALASNPHVTNYYISLVEILLVTRIHSSQTINIMRMKAVLTIDKQL